MKKFYCLVVLLLLGFSGFGQIIAENDTMPLVNGGVGSVNNGNVLSNNGNGADILNSNPVTIALVNLSIIVAATPLFNGAPVPTVNTSTGVVTVPVGTPAGTYTIVYQICEIADPINCDSALVTINIVGGNISLLKDGAFVDVNNNGFANPGDMVSYTFTITNNTTATLTNITIIDPNAVITGVPILLNPGQSDSTTFTGTNVVTQSDIDTGFVYNQATVIGTPPSGPDITAASYDPTPCTICPPSPNCLGNCTVTVLPQNPSILVTMDGSLVDNDNNGYGNNGDAVAYQIIVTNTGNVTLTNINVTMSNGAVLGGPIPSLAVGASNATTFTAVHSLTSTDIFLGQVDAFSTAVGDPPSGPPTTDISNDPTPCATCTPLSPNCINCTIVTFNSNPINLTMQGTYSDYNSDGFVTVGDVINYQYTVANNSALPITTINLTAFNNVVSGGPLAVLAANTNDTTTFTGLHVITQADINSGFVGSNATVTGFLSGAPLSSTSDNGVILNLPNGIKLNAFLDTNNNGVQNIGEPNFALGEFHYQMNGGVMHNITSAAGFHYVYESNPLNSYTISYTLPTPYALQYTIAISSYSNVTVSNGSGITTYNFALTQNPFIDLGVSISSQFGPRPGFEYVNLIVIRNYGTMLIPSGTVTFNVNNVVTTTTYPQGSVPNSTGFTYNFTNLAINETRHIAVNFLVPTIPTVFLGQQITNTVSTTIPDGDIDPLNNFFSSTQTITGSYDPNDKQESHGGRILHSTFTTNDYLTYTIRFENTGTANAINVSVNDVLDSQLNPNSIRMVDASHSYVLDRVGNTLNWRFDGIELPLSVPNTTIGNGYITFQIKPNAGYAIGDIIPNFANIYFDFNPAIVTNTANTEFVTALATSDFAFSNFNYYPNPVKNSLSISNTSTIDKVEITSVLGQTIISQKVNDLQTEVDLIGLSNGVYFAKVISQGQIKTVKIIKE